MKASAIFVALAALAASGNAFSQQYESNRGNDGRATVKSSVQPKEGVGTKLKNALRRAGDKTRQALNRSGDQRTAGHDLGAGPDPDTRAMGGPGASGTTATDDRARRARMDDAYSNWRARQQKSAVAPPPPAS